MNTKLLPVDTIIETIDQLIEFTQTLLPKFSEELSLIDPRYQKSAENLIHYLAFRRSDIRAIQESLFNLGLSSLGRSERSVLHNLTAVRKHLSYLAEETHKNTSYNFVSFEESNLLLKRNTEALFGKSPSARKTYIMVTLSSEAATDYPMVEQLVKNGMDCARINCAHDDSDHWHSMIRNIRKANKNLGKHCKILMDLAGPKLRTGQVTSGPRLLHIKVKKDILGNIVQPSKIFFTTTHRLHPSAITVPIDQPAENMVMPGDIIRFKDPRGKKRKIKVTEILEDGLLGETEQSAYLRSGTKLKIKNEREILFHVGELKAVDIPILLKKGDELNIHKDTKPGEQAVYDEQGNVLQPAHISCSLPEIFEYVKAGEKILLNDGKIEGIIEEVTIESMMVRILNAGPEGSKLRSDKGINLPDTDLKIQGLTNKDKEDLKFVVQHADIVNMSFVSHADDVLLLLKELEKLKADNIGVMLKIETKSGFQNLPLIILNAMRRYPVGIMIARGDLAAEAGWVRLAELQEEILWFCEAAHVPSIWATQVLENLAQKGVPSRAEITDAAMSQRAECVMLNKGPYISEAVKTLDLILKNMEEHQFKKSSRLRSLKVADIRFDRN